MFLFCSCSKGEIFFRSRSVLVLDIEQNFCSCSVLVRENQKNVCSRSVLVLVPFLFANVPE